MAEIWKGKSAADAMLARMREQSAALKKDGVVPTICVFRVGERPTTLPTSAASCAAARRLTSS